MTHNLQAQFATAPGEAAYTDALRVLVQAGEFDRAEQQLLADLATLDRDFARLCLDTPRASVVLEGWPELTDIVAMHEGDPITGVAIGMGNDADMALEKGAKHKPFVTVGIYCDDAFAWSQATRETILAECAADEPAWAGHDEDVEIYCEIDGLTDINTALVRHKNQFFFRDKQPDSAPLGYVEFVLGGWFRALRFHQAVAAQLAEHGLPGNIPVLSGVFGMRPEVASVLYPQKQLRSAAAETAELVITPKERVVDNVVDISGASIRRQVAETEGQPEPEAKRGFFARMFGRR